MIISIDNGRLLIRSLGIQDMEGLKALRRDRKVYRYEPTFLLELQGAPEEALETLRRMDLDTDRQCILGVYEKKILPYWSVWRNCMISNHPKK